MDIAQFINLPFYLITTIAVFALSNSRLIDLQNNFFSAILTSILALSIGGIVTGVLGPAVGLQTSNLVIPTVTFVFLLTLAYSLIQFKILAPELIFYKIVSSFTLIIVLGLSFTVAITLLDLAVVEFSQFRQLVIGVILAIIAILVFQPLRILLEQTVGAIFFKNLAKLERLEAEIDKVILQNFKVGQLASQILEKLTEFSKITGAGIILFENRKSVFSQFLKLGRPKVSQLTKFASLTKPIKLQELNYSLIIPLIWRNNCVGILILGQKLAGAFFTSEISNLKKIAQKFAAPLVHSHAFDKIDKFNLELAEIVEKSTHELAVANQKLSQIDRLKDEFVSLTSHELRTPMTAIKSYLWMALSGRAGKLPKKLAKYLDLAYTSTERMIKLVNDLLNVTRIESEKVEFHPQGVNIVELAKTVVGEVQPEADRRDLTITLVQKNLPLVFADWNRICEVLTNLVGNALKFTPAGGKITISFSKSNGFVETSVTDTGKGIAEADLPRLFRKFGLLPGSLTATRETGGSGLGLYICKSLINLHKGKIWVKSKLGAGSTFSFSLSVANKSQVERFGTYDHEIKFGEITGNLPTTAIPA